MIECKFKEGDKVRVISLKLDVAAENSMNWIEAEPSGVIINEEFIVKDSAINFDHEWLELEGLIYSHPASKFELVDDYSSYLIEDIQDPLKTIADKDFEFYRQIESLVKYLASTFGEKYAVADISTKGLVMSDTLGKGFNVGNAAKYIARYGTTGYSKSENIQDLYKVVHYCLFELQRRAKVCK